MMRGCLMPVMVLIAFAGSAGIIVERAAAQMPSAASVVSTQTYVSLEPVPQAGDFQVAVVVKILDGYHMNSHKPSDAYLIPTTITPQLPAGFELEDTMYPSGEQKTFAFSPSKALDVYTGTVTLRMRIAAKAQAAMGATAIPITLRYQACNNTTCLPPVRVPVTARFEVAAAGTTPREMHPEIFTELKKLR